MSGEERMEGEVKGLTQEELDKSYEGFKRDLKKNEELYGFPSSEDIKRRETLKEILWKHFVRICYAGYGWMAHALYTN